MARAKGMFSQSWHSSLQANLTIIRGTDKPMFSSNPLKLPLPPNRRLNLSVKVNNTRRSSPSAIPILLPTPFEHFLRTGPCGITIPQIATVQQVGVMGQEA